MLPPQRMFKFCKVPKVSLLGGPFVTLEISSKDLNYIHLGCPTFGPPKISSTSIYIMQNLKVSIKLFWSRYRDGSTLLGTPQLYKGDAKCWPTRFLFVLLRYGFMTPMRQFLLAHGFHFMNPRHHLVCHNPCKYI